MNLTSIITSDMLYIYDEISVDAYSKVIGEFNLIYDQAFPDKNERGEYQVT